MKIKNRKLGRVAVMAVALLGSLAAEATIIFNDTFDYASSGGALTSAINTNLAARQAAGTTTSSYSKGGSPESYLQDNAIAATGFGSDTMLFRVYEATGGRAHQLDLGTDFRASLVGNVWSLSYRAKVAANTVYTGWTGFSVGNAPNTPNGGGAGFGININQGGTATMWQGGVNLGTFALGPIAGVVYELTATFDEGAETVSLTFNKGAGEVDMGTYPTAFTDDARQIELKNFVAADAAATGTGFVDWRFDDLTISAGTVVPPTPVVYQIEFFDTFDTADTSDVNADYITRQSTGTVTSPYTEGADESNLIANHQLSIISGGALDLDTNLVSQMVGQDFKVSIDATMLNTTNNWAAFYVLSANETARQTSRMGFHYWGAAQGTAFSVYSGVDEQVVTGVTVAQLNAVFGSYDRELPHTIEFIATEGPTNTYDFVVDGVVFLYDLPYAFSEETTRTLGFIATVAPANLGVLYDNLSVSVPAPAATYAQWVIDHNLEGADALSTADVEPDGMDNLLEYALGGDPNVDDAASVLPVSGVVESGGTNWFGYVYNRRVDAAERGLDYGLILKEDLILGPWTNIGTSAEIATATLNADFESVTNVIATVDEVTFVSLEVTEN